MSNNTHSIKEILKTVKSDSCPNYVNLHLHTQFSDGSLTPTQLIKKSSDIKVKYISVTDHHTIKAYEEIYSWIEENSNLKTIPIVFTGIEITAIMYKKLVHILGFDFSLNHKSLLPYINSVSTRGKYLDSEYVVNSIHEAGGLAILAHPARYKLSLDQIIEEAHRMKFDGAEAWYDYSYSKNWKPTPLICDKISKKLSSLNMLSTCGTDTHGYSILHR
tara:strand:+ start:638 stop:1291 length:654 start_codon:yes stop_codon:yes gene_type:complete